MLLDCFSKDIDIVLMMNYQDFHIIPSSLGLKTDALVSSIYALHRIFTNGSLLHDERIGSAAFSRGMDSPSPTLSRRLDLPQASPLL